MGQFVTNHRGHGLQLPLVGLVRVDQQEDLAERDAAQVLHGAESEVGQGDQVDLSSRYLQVVPVGKPPKRVGGHLQGERRLVAPPRRVDDPDWHAVHVDRLGRLERPDHEGHQVGGQGDGVDERHPVGAVAQWGTRGLGTVGDGQQVLGDDQRHPERGFHVWLVEAREGPAGVGGLELGCGDGVLGAVVGDQGAPVEAS